ncbi:branched-chain amino acid ABC transporter permease [Roseomonas sp. CCTCC AB2023176]|uniref:branched-chain amino acid ABC transporter permease n=1 Tax=Roseomonas sp. CCTCC AB2023176 TaxID=3342640 RepID=UPI0035DFC00A
MRIGALKQTYDADHALLDTGVQRAWAAAGIAALILLPFIGSEYVLYLACLAAIHVVAATGLNILTGYTGLVSLGHAAFMGVGAYAAAVADSRLGTSAFLNLFLGGCAAAVVGVVVGLPSLRVKGLYLAIATIGASVLLDFVFKNWTPVTGGTRGLNLPPATLLGWDLARPSAFWWLVMPVAVLSVLAAANLFRTRIGRAFIAVRDRDISAAVLGIPLLRTKLMSFGLSSFYAGVAGALFAYFFRSITPESFPFVYSIFFLAAIIVGGMGTILGGVIGAIFMTLVPEALKLIVAVISPVWPNAVAVLSPVRTVIFGALIVGFLIFEPHGLAEIWRRIRRFFHLWPFRT